jgi:cytochrome b561
MSTAHLALTWALFVLFALHIAGVAKHVIVNRDGLWRRMWWR